MQRINQLSGIALVALSSIALITVVVGVTMALADAAQPQSDEGTLAHLFQLAVAAALPTALAFMASSDWDSPSRSVRTLGVSGAIMALAFSLLYYGEHHLRL
jgi:hypothetical protein